jgi:hypothetical protein
MHPNVNATDLSGPFAGVFQAPGRSGGILTEALVQEGISFIDLPVTEVSRLWNGQLPSTRVAVLGAVPSPDDKLQLAGWVNQGGGLVLMNCDLWPAEELAQLFGLERTLELTEGGYLWPSSPEFSFPAVANEALQIVGPRYLYRVNRAATQVLAEGSSHPTAVVAFDANRDGFSDDEWFWNGQFLCRYARGRAISEDFILPGLGPCTPTAAAAGDFTSDGLRDNLWIARGNVYAIMRGGLWTDVVQLPHNIRHILAYETGGPFTTVSLFLDDGSLFVTSTDGGRTFSPVQVFAPGGIPVVTDFGYSYETVDDYGLRRVVLNLWSQGAFYTNTGAGWSDLATLPDLGPKYLLANVMSPTLGYASDANRVGLRNQISLLINSNVYARDPVTNGFNYPQQFHKLYKVGRQPLVVRSGRVVGFLYDFESTVLRLQQGADSDPSVATQLVQISQTGAPVVFSPVINMFDNFIDYCQLDLPQADLHERLLRQIVTAVGEVPLPRVWYLPNGYRSVASLSHDIETAGPNQQTAVELHTLRIGEIAATHQRNDTFFSLMTDDLGVMSPADFQQLQNQGHHVTVHFDSIGSTDFTPANFQRQSNLMKEYGITPVTGSRSHGLSWVKDYVAQAIATQPETVYDSTFGGGPGYSHCGSVLPYRLYSPVGQAYESFHEISHGLMDISDSKFFFSSLAPAGQLALQLDDLFFRARDMAKKNHDAYYGIFDSLFHPVVVAGLVEPIPEFMDEFEAFASFLNQEGIPSMTLVEVAEWWALRRGLRVGNINWNANTSTLQFTLAATTPVNNATVVIPAQYQNKLLTAVQDQSGTAQNFTIDLLDGQNHGIVVFPAVIVPVQIAVTYA